MSYEEKLKYVSVVATPIASKKFAKKIYKLIKKGSKQKTYVRSGLKVKKICNLGTGSAISIENKYLYLKSVMSYLQGLP